MLSTNIIPTSYLDVELKKLEHGLVAFCSLQLACLFELIISYVHVGNHPKHEEREGNKNAGGCDKPYIRRRYTARSSRECHKFIAFNCDGRCVEAI
jgi:hypothetical protein